MAENDGRTNVEENDGRSTMAEQTTVIQVHHPREQQRGREGE
jgi:hypothetical protein